MPNGGKQHGGRLVVWLVVTLLPVVAFLVFVLSLVIDTLT